MSGSRLQKDFFIRDVLDVTPDLLGKYLVRKNNDGSVYRYRITEVEAYRGEEDLACHASKGRTPRTEIMYHDGGHLYVYLIYGMYWMLNIVTGTKDNPQAILLRGIDTLNGPGKLTKHLQIDKSFCGENLISSDRIWIEEDINHSKLTYVTSPRVGIDYAGNIWKNKPWRFILKT